MDWFKNSPVSNKEILSVALPLILGSLGHNLIAATDTFFLGRYGTTELAAIGLVAPLYLLITMVGLSFSRGGQIMIARRVGEGRFRYIGQITQAMFYFQMALAISIFLIITFGNEWILSLFINSQELLDLCVAYMDYRIDGIFFGYVGVIGIALYSGVGRARVIIYSTLVLAVVNVVLNYLLIFGSFGFPKMGIGGAGLASTIAEGAAMLTFIVYALFDKEAKSYQLFKIPRIDFDMIIDQLRLSTPIALQSFIGLGAWFVFFAFIENLGKQALAVSSGVRVIFIFLGVPSWGLSSATNTVVSNLIGQGKQKDVFATLTQTVLISLVLTGLPCLGLMLFPEWVMGLITNDNSIIADAVPILQLLAAIMAIVAMYNIYFNGIVAAGAIGVSLIIEILAVLCYLVYVYVMVEVMHANLSWVWAAELVNGLVMLGLSIWYLRTNRWHHLKV